MGLARTFAALFLAACILATGAASAQTYPNRPITLVVPYPPGGATDAIARIMQLFESLDSTTILGQTKEKSAARAELAKRS